jgi:hypothetical protein
VRSRIRFAAPVLVAGLVGLGAAVPAFASGGRPRLPAESADQIVAGVLDSHVPAVSGTIRWDPALGLPSLSGLGSAGQGVPSAGGLDPTSLLSTAQSFRLWVDGSDERLATNGSLAETDIIRRGDEVWVWDSTDQHVEQYRLPARPDMTGPAPIGFEVGAVASQLLRGLGSAGTSVSVGTPVDVAGVPCQVLSLRPADPATSTVSSVDIAVDAANSVPLRVTVRAVGQQTPALELGFTSVSFAPPAESVFAPPHGLSTSVHTVFPGTGGGLLPAPPSPGAWYGYSPSTGSGSAASTRSASPARVIGHGWSSVADVAVVSSSPTLTELEAAATPVSGSFGSGRLLRSSLLDVLVLHDGHLLVGFVPPSVLEADAAALAG